ncbi:hypothetical protein QQX98_008470 [Neonectria punicea]|uniref:Zn(2)-C6 fungal-type domain-containing protein n=1 Tax=Neonectria punicea TaxID=979145 RepID=A0ABR1GVF5_9HYPO
MQQKPRALKTTSSRPSTIPSPTYQPTSHKPRHARVSDPAALSKACDEEGPPCGNCFVRGLNACAFPTPPSSSSQDADLQSASSFLSPEARHRIELELMHRWTTSTYKSLCTIPEDQHWIQVSVPRWGLKQDFLLHGAFSLSAFEIALCGGSVLEKDPKVYVKLALEYYQKASKSFREDLGSITPENLKAMYVFSSIAVLINMAIPQCEDMTGGGEPQSILARMIALFDLLIKSCSIVLENIDALMNDPEAAVPMNAGLEAINKAPSHPLPSDVEAALARCHAVIDKGVDVAEEQHANAREEALLRVQSCRMTVSALRVCFVEDSKEMIKGLCIAFPSLAGPGFAAELKRSEPVAMFLMMHWGVLLHHLGKTMWWAKTIGRRMVLEISEILLQLTGTQLSEAHEWRDGIIWAREAAELSSLAEAMDKD